MCIIGEDGAGTLREIVFDCFHGLFIEAVSMLALELKLERGAVVLYELMDSMIFTKG